MRCSKEDINLIKMLDKGKGGVVHENILSMYSH
jgi:hypothetical protein